MKVIVSVIDVVFNPNIQDLSTFSQQFKKMICDVAVDGVQKKLDIKKEKVNKDYSISKLLCKGDKPSLMPV